jgi:hypothetical protein
MRGQAVLMNVRRYRAIAPLYRQTAGVSLAAKMLSPWTRPRNRSIAQLRSSKPISRIATRGPATCSRNKFSSREQDVE